MFTYSTRTYVHTFELPVSFWAILGGKHHITVVHTFRGRSGIYVFTCTHSPANIARPELVKCSGYGRLWIFFFSNGSAFIWDCLWRTRRSCYNTIWTIGRMVACETMSGLGQLKLCMYSDATFKQCRFFE